MAENTHREPRTCPLCGLNQKTEQWSSLYVHLRNDHKRDHNDIAFHLVQALRRNLNRRTR